MCDKTICEIADKLEPKTYTSREFIYEIGIYLKSNANYIGMLVRGAGEGFNLIVPVRRMIDYCEKHKIMWALDKNVAMPTEDELKKMPVEHEPKEKDEDTADEAAAKKMFPYRLRVTYPKVLILQE